MVACHHREAISADLVREIAVGADPVGPDEYDVHLGLSHERCGSSVSDQRARDPGVRQLPHREARALEERPCLVYVDMYLTALLVREIDRGESRPNPPRCQSAGIAVRQDICPVRENRQTIL